MDEQIENENYLMKKRELTGNDLNQEDITNNSINININTNGKENNLASLSNDDKTTSNKLIWTQINNKKLSQWMKRPARQQVTDSKKDTSYIEGHYDYNIWYDKYSSDRNEEKGAVAALYKCNPMIDTGYTRADIQEKKGNAFCCLFFAKGCCSFGVNCRYYHRVPTLEDCNFIENMKDIFGRSRHATHRQDMSGVGVFTNDCRTIFVPLQK